MKDGAGESVIGASVLQKGTTNGTITDFEGGFTLNLPSNSVIVVSFVGYKTQEIAVAGKTDLTVTLTEDTQLLGNVVVVGYGTQKKEDLTSAIATLSPKEVLNSEQLYYRCLARKYCRCECVRRKNSYSRYGVYYW